MGVLIKTHYNGQLKTTLTHTPSGAVTTTDAPRDNGGDASTFSPTDMVAGALGSCMLTLMGITARKLDIDISGSSAEVMKEMVATPRRRIAALRTSLTIRSKQLTSEQKKALEFAALTCPVKESIHPEIDATTTFIYETL